MYVMLISEANVLLLPIYCIRYYNHSMLIHVYALSCMLLDLVYLPL